MLIARNTKLSTFSDLRQVLLSETTCPPQLKTCSDATLVAHRHKYFCASFATVGYLTASIFHQSSADSLTSKSGWLKYWSSSCFTRW